MDDKAKWRAGHCEGPEEALFPGMPKNVMQYVEIDHQLTASGIGSLMASLVTEKAPKRPDLTREKMELLKMEVVIATRGDAFETGILDMGAITTFACPETLLMKIRQRFFTKNIDE